MNPDHDTLLDLIAVLLSIGGEATIEERHLEAACSGKHAVTAWEEGGQMRLRLTEAPR